MEKKVFETKSFGFARMINAMLPGMRQRRQGHSINVGSASAWVGEPGEAFYSASKHALAGYSQAPTTDSAIAGYDAVRSAASRTFRQALQRGDDPAKVAQLIVKIARDRAPR